jgi:N-acetylglucosamine malate deacetylase 1
MNVVAIVAHPDDETLGCGGTLLKHRAAGDHISWVIATEGHEPHWSAEMIAQKANEVEEISRAYGVAQCVKLGFPSGRLDVTPQQELIEGIHGAISEIRPSMIYTVHGGDVHTDHQAVFTATMSAVKPFRMRELGVQRILSFEAISSTDGAPPLAERVFMPQIYNDITDHINQKIDVMRLYATEIHQDPLPRGPEAIRALARYRGAAVAVAYAEAFMLIREVL